MRCPVAIFFLKDVFCQTKMKTNYTKTSGEINFKMFSLIELLIVTAMIAILASMLLPMLNMAREMAHSIACANNLKQLGFSFSSYVNDNNDYFPPAHLDQLTGDSNLTYAVWNWAYMLQRDTYVATGKLYRCPSAEKIMPGNSTTYHRDLDQFLKLSNNASSWKYIGYGYNNNYIGSHAGIVETSFPAFLRYQPVRTTEMKKISSCFVLAETKDMYSGILTGYYLTFENGRYIHDLHRGGTNLLFADGHVGYTKNGTNRLNSSVSKEYYTWK